MTIAEQMQHARAQDLLTVEQVSLLTQLHFKSIYRMISRGTLPVVRLGRAVRIPRSALRTVRTISSE